MDKLIFTNSRGQSITLKNSAPFILTKFDNGSTKSTIITSKSPGQNGKSLHGAVLEESIKPIECAVVGEDITDLLIKRQQLYSTFTPETSGTLRYLNNVGEYLIDCIVQDVPAPKNRVANIQEFLIQMYCPNPFWTDIKETKEEIATWIGDFSFDLEIPNTGIEMGHRESNLIVNVINKGDIECGMRIEFMALATVVNPSLFDVYTRKYIKVKRTLQRGDKLIINTSFANKRVELVRSNGIIQNVFNWIDLNTEFLQLAVGDNLLRYDAEKGIDNLEVAIYHKHLYLGR